MINHQTTRRLTNVSNFFFFESQFKYEPVIKQVDPAVANADMGSLRKKILNIIKQQVDQKDLSRSEVAFATRMSSAAIGPILNGNIEKVSTDRLLRMARMLGLKPKIKFSVEN